MNILRMNQEVFGSSFAISKMNRSAKQAVDSELIVPASATDMSYDEMEYVDGGGRFQLSITCTIGGAVSGLATGVVTGFIVGFITAKFTKFGAMAGWVGALISTAISGIMGYALSRTVNNMIYGTSGPSKVTLVDIWIPFAKIKYNIDIGQKIASFLGGFGGGLGGAAAATASGYAFGLVTA